MPLRIFNDDDLLDLSFRQEIIKEIEGEENRARKSESFKRYEIYKDKTKKYVLDHLRKELEPDTLIEVEPRTANVSVTKTIVNKKARVYSGGVKRVSQDEVYEKQIEDIAYLTELNTNLKRIDAYKNLEKNAELYIYPVLDDVSGKYYQKLMPLMPHSYDVIEDFYCPENKRAIIFSYFTNKYQTMPYSGGDERTLYSPPKDFHSGDGIDQTIADASGDKGGKYKLYVVWSTKYHFTMNEKGFITNSLGEELLNVSKDELANPIGVIPSVSYNEGQDGNYWAQGGDDLIDGSILLNVLMTDMNFISKLQGMGIFYFFGKGVPKTVKLGPNRGISHEVQPNDPIPQIGFATSNPPLDQHMRMIEQYAGLLLTTNGLSPSTISNKLDAQNFSSGVHELISKSEVNASIEDEQEYYGQKEKEVMMILASWQNLYYEKGLLAEEYMEIGKITDSDNFSTVYKPVKAMLSPMENLELIEKRQELSLDSKIDSLMRDNPDMTREEAEEKLKLILEEKLQYNSSLLRNSVLEENEGDTEENEGDTEEDEMMEEEKNAN